MIPPERLFPRGTTKFEKMTPMLKSLHETESIMLDLLKDKDKWVGIRYVKYDPLIHRLTRRMPNGFIVHLNKIHKCKRMQPGLHAHMAPSAMRVIHGRYRMWSSFGETDQEWHDAPITCYNEFGIGDVYTMEEARCLHMVDPITDYTYSIMTNGKSFDHRPKIPYDHQNPSDMQEMPEDEREEMFNIYTEYYSK